MATLGSPGDKRVVIVDDDRDVAELVQSVLVDEGFRVAALYNVGVDQVTAAIAKLEPDCVLLDGSHRGSYGSSWELARWLTTQPRPVATVMLTAHIADYDETLLDESERAHGAHFIAAIPKPFDIDRLVATIRLAVGLDPEPSKPSDVARLSQLLDRLRAAGARDVRASAAGREWATFVGNDGSLFKVYRWRAADVYFVGRYSPDGRQMQPLGQFYALEPVIEYCLSYIGPGRVSS